MTEPSSFAAPWEARTFAIVRALRDSGVVSADEWTAALRTAAGGGEVRYDHWLAALERVLAANGVVTPAALEQYRLAWLRAAHRTPHGEPIELDDADVRP